MWFDLICDLIATIYQWRYGSFPAGCLLTIGLVLSIVFILATLA